MSRRHPCLRLAVAAAALLGTAAPAAAQRVQTAVLPESITVGDVFRAAIRIELDAPDAQVIAPDSITLPEDLELAGRREVRTDTAGGARRVTLVYPLTAWRPGEYTIPGVDVQLVRNGASTVLTARLPAFQVRSVLPADTAGIQPQPAKDVLGASRLWWPLLLALLAALLVAAALYALWRRRRRGRADELPTVVPTLPPREAALALLDELQRSGALERGELKRFYEVLTETLRRYAASVDASWSTDLTTSELAQRLRTSEGTGIGEALELTRILGAADLVKFAQARVPHDAAAADLQAARAWIERVPAPPPAETEAAGEDRRAA